MGKTKPYLDLNGLRYDADTGSVISGSALKPAAMPARSPKLVVDGFVRRPGVSPNMGPAAKPVKIKPQRTNISTAQNAHRKQQHTKTLMRHSVHKPSLGSLFHAKAVPLVANAAPVGVAAQWPSTNNARLHRAQKTQKNDLVNRFSTTSAVMRTAVLPVKQTTRAKSSHSASFSHKQVVAKAENPFEHALSNARSHEQPRPKRPRLRHKVAHKLHLSHKAFNITMLVLAVILFGAFVLYQNLSNLSVRLAATRAGLHASLPGYYPAGFSLSGPVQYAPGQVTLNFKSNSDSRVFQVKQQASSWNSDALLQSYVSKTDQPYQTYQDNGRTVYIDNNGANLVTGDKWIQVKNEGSLSTEQLLNIVKSIN